MSYTEKLALVKAALIIYCKQRITDNWDKHFDMWLDHEADMEFGHGYQDAFNKEFSKYMNSTIKDTLWLAGINIGFAIGAFISYKKNAKVSDVLEFTEQFLLQQLDTFDNWCEDISSAMYDDNPT